MKTFIAAILVATTSLAFAGIANTKHNLGTSSGNPGANKTTSGAETTADICVFCHTPHGADTTAAAPLWNKKINASTVYTTYASLNSSTIDGEILAIGSVSVACLSCHDGAQAMDNVINAPGSGGYDATGGGTNGVGYTWAGNVSAEGILGSGVSNLGTDMKNDHPIGVEYCGGGVAGSGSSISGSCKDADFIAPITKSVNGSQVFWVETGTADGVRGKNDMILYTRTFAGSIQRGSVECGSCHDPHQEPKNAGEVNFMRVATAGSAICLACHVK